MAFGAFENLLVIALGFSTGGLLCSAYQVFALRPATFGILTRAPRHVACAHLPLLVFAAPFLIVRNITKRHRGDGPGFIGVTIATVFAALWGMMSGTVVLLLVRSTGVI